MVDYGIPILYALFVWWFSTGAIIYLDGLPRHTFRWSLLGATVLFVISLHGLALSSADTSVFGAYAAFTYALFAWAWHEMSFLMGLVTGPYRRPLPPTCTGFQRFGYALLAILYHELAIAGTALVVLVLTWGEPNQVGALTYLVLWGMRLSAKLNLFFGVRITNQEFLPDHLKYLQSFFGGRTMNLFFPLSVTSATLLTAWLVHVALAPETGSAAAIGYTCLAALSALGTLEHWLMVVPLPAKALWSWGMKSRDLPDIKRPSEKRNRNNLGDSSYSITKTEATEPDRWHTVLWSRLKIALIN